MSATEALSASAQRRLSRRMKPEERPCYARRKIAGTVTIEIPVPPSTNKLFFNVPGAGRKKTRSYREWCVQALLVGSLPTGEPRRPPCRIAGPCRVAIILPPGRADGDNLVKPCLDAAVAIGIIADDGPKYVLGHSVDRDPTRANVRMVFAMLPIDEMVRAEVEVGAREGQSVAYIAAARGLTDGKVEAILEGGPAMMPRLDFAETPEADAQIADLVIRVWKSGQDTMAMAKAIRVRAEVMGEPVPHLSAAQAHAHNVLALYRDTVHALRQREAHCAPVVPSHAPWRS